MIEIWKPIDGFPGYEISNLGNVKSYKVNKSGQLMKFRKSQVYATIALRVDGMSKDEKFHKKVHFLVAKAFVDNPNNYPVVDHLDANKWNNKATNLEWVTAQENSARAKKMGLYQSRVGTKNTQVKLTELDVVVIRETWAKFGRGCQKHIMAYYGLGSFIVSAICQRRRWKHI